jgi:hypothetical protein
MSNGIENKVVIIAGASSGIGEATTRRLAPFGVGSSSEPGGRRSSRSWRHPCRTPTSATSRRRGRPKNMESLAQTALEKHGRIDATFNNAGVMPPANLSELHRDEFRDYAASEKISDPPRRLNTSDVPAGYDPSVGDLTLHAPWGNLAFLTASQASKGGGLCSLHGRASPPTGPGASARLPCPGSCRRHSTPSRDTGCTAW